MTMSKGMGSCLRARTSQLKVLCGLTQDQATFEEIAIEAVVCDPIPSEKFLNVYKQRLQQGEIDIEFKALSRNQETHSTRAALKNTLLNVKQDTVPYDHSRVILLDRTRAHETDYFNASYIDGYTTLQEYIVCQGPNTKCLMSFWHLVWQEGVTCIVMATGLFENAVQQCNNYWMDNNGLHAQYGYIHIWKINSQHLAQLNIHTFRVQKEGCDEWRALTHYELVGFHDEDTDPGLLLDVRRRIDSIRSSQTGPMLVHCRCGGGRSAVFIAVDYCLHQLRSENRVDVYSTVLHLRRFRKNMVRTLNQYTLIYKAVALYIQCGLSVHPANTFPDIFHLDYTCDSDTAQCKLEREFQILGSIALRLSIGDCACGHRVENRSKSRDIMVLPRERARPYLVTTDCAHVGTDFINAVYVDSYHSENMYLATQWPMKRTLCDLWRLMYDLKMTSIVFMNDPHKFSRNYPRFWPKTINQTSVYGPNSVRYLSCERRVDMVTRTFAIRKFIHNPSGCEVQQNEIVVRMFQILRTGRRGSNTSYLNHNISTCSGSYHSRTINEIYKEDEEKCRRQGKMVEIQAGSLLAVMKHVTDWQKHNNSRKPICVISKDGYSHIGLYCAIALCCEQVKEDGEVDVFNAVRLVRRHRPQLVPNIEEYIYIYQFMAEFILLAGLKPEPIVSESNLRSNQTSCGQQSILPLATLHNKTASLATVFNYSHCHKGPESMNIHNMGDNSIYKNNDIKGNNSIYTNDDIKGNNSLNTNNDIMNGSETCATNHIKPNGYCYSNRNKQSCPTLALGRDVHYGLYHLKLVDSLEREIKQDSSRIPNIFRTVDSCNGNRSVLHLQLSNSEKRTIRESEHKHSRLLSDNTESAVSGSSGNSIVSHKILKNVSQEKMPVPSLPSSASSEYTFPSRSYDDYTILDNTDHTSRDSLLPEIPESQHLLTLCKSSSRSNKSQNYQDRQATICEKLPRHSSTNGDIHLTDDSRRALPVHVGIQDGSMSTKITNPETNLHNKNELKYRATTTSNPPQSEVKPYTRSNDQNKVTLVHASYASMDEESLTNSPDEREHFLSFESMDEDIEKSKHYLQQHFLVKPGRRKVHFPKFFNSKK